MLKIAIPNKGTLSEDAIRLVSESGYSCKRYSSELAIIDSANQIEFYFLRPRDIAVYVGSGFLDLGITGRDLTFDSGTTVHEIMPLNFGHSSFYYAAPAGCDFSVDKLEGKRIATSYPRIVQNDLNKRGSNASIIKLDGAVEISIRLGVADVIADVVQSGRTLTEAGLVKIGEPLMKSEAILISRSAETITLPDAALFFKRLKGIIVAREFVMVEYDIPKKELSHACGITPGIESPTIAPLSNENWVAVKAMIKRKEMNQVMDRLSDIGAKGIIITEIKTCRV